MWKLNYLGPKVEIKYPRILELVKKYGVHLWEVLDEDTRPQGFFLTPFKTLSFELQI